MVEKTKEPSSGEVGLAIDTSWGKKGQKPKESDWFSGVFIAQMFWCVKGGKGKSPRRGSCGTGPRGGGNNWEGRERAS